MKEDKFFWGVKYKNGPSLILRHYPVNLAFDFIVL